MHRIGDHAGEAGHVQQPLLQVELPGPVLLREEAALEAVGISLALNFDHHGPQGAKSNYPAMGRTNPIHTMIRTGTDAYHGTASKFWDDVVALRRLHLAQALALRRELHEELGITIGAAHPWKIELMDYPHARVRLHFCKVFEWSGAFEMREGQQMAWQTLPVAVVPVLPGTIPVLRWFAQERGHAGPTHRG